MLTIGCLVLKILVETSSLRCVLSDASCGDNYDGIVRKNGTSVPNPSHEPSDIIQRRLPNNKVFMSGPWLPYEVIEKNRRIEPNMNFLYFGDAEMAKSVKEISEILNETEGIKGVFEAWSILRPWAFRADLWRYMILWKDGGTYLDSKVVLSQPLSTWASLSNDEHLSICKDKDLYVMSKSHQRGYPFLWNGAMSAKKGSPILLSAIRLCVQNIQSRLYKLPDAKNFGHHVVGITGPMLLGYAAAIEANCSGCVRLSCKFGTGFDRQGRYSYQLSDDGRNVTNMELFSINVQEHKKIKTNSDYWKLYTTRQVYCDDPKSEHTPIPDSSCVNVPSLLL